MVGVVEVSGKGWFTVSWVVYIVLASRSLKCPPQVRRSPAEGSQEGTSCRGQEGEGSGRPLHCSSHNPVRHKDTLDTQKDEYLCGG